jgi:DNA polymerase sigma
MLIFKVKVSNDVYKINVDVSFIRFNAPTLNFNHINEYYQFHLKLKEFV